jgi:mono/diheme cytochrome c family protein
MRRWPRIILGTLVALGLGAAAFFFWPASLPAVAASAAQPSGAALVARGEYLARAGDCVACHTAPGGQEFAGGRPFELPFGTIYSSNITPDRETGIGAWSDAEFVRALRRGVGRHGEDLYPVFPYTAYAQLTLDDALAIRAYLASLTPVREPRRANELGFPFNQRYAVRAWKALFLPAEGYRPNPSRDAAWNRGAYLVEALAHCGECHTPRNVMFALDQRRAYAGEVQDGWLAYNISSDRETGIGAWSDEQLTQYLSTGRAEGRGPASGPMAEAVSHSLRFLQPDDIRAMVTYLRSIPAQSNGPPIVQPVAATVDPDPLGARLFAQACAGCHLPGGGGRQSPWAALAGSRTAGDPVGTNLVQVLTRGTELQTSQGLMFMHAFTGGYTDAELAALANYVIRQFGGRQGQVTAEQVARSRGPAQPIASR